MTSPNRDSWWFLIGSLFVFAIAGGFLYFAFDSFEKDESYRKVSQTNCTVLRCFPIVVPCYYPSNPILQNCTTYEIEFSLNWHGTLYRNREKSEEQCPSEVTCQFIEVDIGKTLTLGNAKFSNGSNPWAAAITSLISCIILSLFGLGLLVMAIVKFLPRSTQYNLITNLPSFD